MNAKPNHIVFCLALTLPFLLGSATNAADTAAATTPPVVMVCEHGTVKSVIAVQLFDQEAKERGLPFRAISRGIAPDEHIPGKIAQALENDGFDVSDFKSQKLSSQDVSSSSRVIAIGSDLSAFQGDSASPIQQWDDIPPASVDYEASKASLLTHIHALLDELEDQAR